MATKTTGSIFNDSANQSKWATWTKYFSFPISTINDALNNTSNVPDNAKINSVTINVSVKYECASAANVYFKFGIGDNGSINSELMGENQIGSLSMTKSETQSKTLPISSNTSPYAISTVNGSYFTICIYTGNYSNKTFWVTDVTLTIDYEIPTYTITANSNNSSYGTVSGGGTYNNGTTVKLTATPKTGCKFVKWSDGNTDNPRTVTVTGNASYTAEFGLEKYTLTIDRGDHGIVKGNDSTTYNYGDTVTLEVEAHPGYLFKKWSDGNTDNPRTITITGDASYSVVYERGCYISVGEVSDQGTIEGATHGSCYEKGTTLTVTAIPNVGYQFKSWVIKVGENSSTFPTDNPLTLVLTEDTVISAIFTEALPEFISAQLLYSDKQVSQSNKVKAGEGFRIIIDVQ